MEYCGSLVRLFKIKYDIPVIPRREQFLIKYFSYLIYVDGVTPCLSQSRADMLPLQLSLKCVILSGEPSIRDIMERKGNGFSQAEES